MAFDYQEWYALHREELSAERKKRYRIDKKYREACKRRSRKYYARTKRIRYADRYALQAKEGLFYTIGRVAKFMGVSTAYVRDLHRMSIIPPVRFYDSRGWRLYSKWQVNLLAREYKKFKATKGYTLQDMGASLSILWNKEPKKKRVKGRRTNGT